MNLGAAYAVEDKLEAQERTADAPPSPALDTGRLLTFYEDIRNQPPWRNQADKHVDYYDGNQLDAQTIADLEQKGMGPLITNIVAPIINVVLGMEAKTRTDWRIVADSDQWTDLAEAGSYKLHEVERESRADRACSDGYAGQIKAGIGWVEVYRSSNPFEYPYRIAHIHRREMFWDWRDQDPALDKSLYQVRKRWYDVEQAAAYFPDHAALLRSAINGDQMRYELERERLGLTLFNSFEQERGLAIEDIEEWRSFSRKRVALHEVWYRHWVRGYVLKLPNGDVVEFDKKNPMHLVLVGRGMVRPEPAVYSKLRMSIWAGPNRLHDCPCRANHTPYVPFWGYREDRTGVPYGLIRAMISPQDEVNVRRQKMMWLMGAKRITMDSDALDLASNDITTMLSEVSRPDAVVVLNPNRVNKAGAFNVEHNLGLSEQQFKIMLESKQSAQEVVGVFNALLGRESGSSSGVAIDSLVEQGTTALAEINDNYRFARRTVGERAWELVREDLIGQRVDVVIEESGRKRTISLNAVGRDEQSGKEFIINDVRAAKVKVALDDVPSTPAYRQQQITMLAEVMKGLPPNLQAAIAPFYLEATDLQKRREMAQAVRKAMGINEPQTPEEAKQIQQQAAEAAMFNRQAVLLDLEERAAKADKMRAEAAKVRSEIDGAGEDAKRAFDERANAAEVAAKAEIDKLTTELLRVRQEAASKESRLADEVRRLVLQLKSNGADRDAELRKAEIEREIATINAEKDKEVARIQADADKAVDKFSQQLTELKQRIEEVSKDKADEPDKKESATA